MQNALPTAEWVDHFKWKNSNGDKKRDWSPEEDLCFDLALRYAEENSPLENPEEAKDQMKLFIQVVHEFINYEQSNGFEGFDWFLATVFIICDGQMDK